MIGQCAGGVAGALPVLDVPAAIPGPSAHSVAVRSPWASPCCSPGWDGARAVACCSSGATASRMASPRVATAGSWCSGLASRTTRALPGSLTFDRLVEMTGVAADRVRFRVTVRFPAGIWLEAAIKSRDWDSCRKLGRLLSAGELMAASCCLLKGRRPPTQWGSQPRLSAPSLAPPASPLERFWVSLREVSPPHTTARCNPWPRGTGTTVGGFGRDGARRWPDDNRIALVI
jgi:hypothetical protein